MDSKEIIKENTDSVELSRNAKGEFAYKIKVYGDSTTAEGIGKMEQNLRALRSKVQGMLE